jgi:hypothetical protein
MTMRKTDDERLQALEEKMAQIKAKKQQLASRIQSKERKERTRRLIQVGAIFESYFDIIGEDQAEKVAYGMKDAVEKHRAKLMTIDVTKSKKQKRVIYESQEERVVMPEGNETPGQAELPKVSVSPTDNTETSNKGGFQFKHMDRSNE